MKYEQIDGNQEGADFVNPQALSLYNQDKAQVDTQVATAHAYPRNITRLIENAIKIVSLSKETAESCIYALPRGGKKISGPSIHLAKILAQNWGNLRISNKVVAIDDKHITSQGVCWDLETNVAVQTEVKRLIFSETNGRFKEDMITVTGNAANAISLRNAVLSVIPRQVVEKVMAAVKNAITGDISDEIKLGIKRDAIFQNFIDNYKVTEEEILKAVGKSARNNINQDDIVTLIGFGTALKDGDTTVDDLFRNKRSTVAENKDKAEERKKSLIEGAKDIPSLEKFKELATTQALMAVYDEKYKSLITQK